MLALVESISSKSAVAQMASQSAIKLAAVKPLLDSTESAQMVANHYGESLSLARIQIAQAQQSQLQSGF
jgi:hypothetical protein